MRKVRFTQSARKHRIGRAHAMYVINTAEPVVTPATDEMNERRSWIGEDDRGVDWRSQRLCCRTTCS